MITSPFLPELDLLSLQSTEDGSAITTNSSRTTSQVDVAPRDEPTSGSSEFVSSVSQSGMSYPLGATVKRD